MCNRKFVLILWIISICTGISEDWLLIVLKSLDNKYKIEKDLNVLEVV